MYFTPALNGQVDKENGYTVSQVTLHVKLICYVFQVIYWPHKVHEILLNAGNCTLLRTIKWTCISSQKSFLRSLKNFTFTSMQRCFDLSIGLHRHVLTGFWSIIERTTIKRSAKIHYFGSNLTTSSSSRKEWRVGLAKWVSPPFT